MSLNSLKKIDFFVSISSLPPPSALGVIEIDKESLAHNFIYLKSLMGEKNCASVVKANAYGLGIEEVALPLAQQAECREFFVATLDEAITLRTCLNGFNNPSIRHSTIYVLGGIFEGTEDIFHKNNLTPILINIEQIKLWNKFLQKIQKPLKAILHFDTGMARTGLGKKETIELFEDPSLTKELPISCVMSHLACASEMDLEKNQRQLLKFKNIIARFPQTPASLVNSTGLFLDPSYRFDIARIGQALYGFCDISTPETHVLQPVFKLKARIVQVHSLEKGDTIGYGSTYVAKAPMRIATLGLGYADGLPRYLSDKGSVFIEGRAAKIVGRVSMDYTTIDVTHFEENKVTPGVWVDLLDPKDPINSFKKFASDSGTIVHEALTRLGSRFHRTYSSSFTQNRQTHCEYFK